jgi:acetyl-CoA carboxylase biotin carboxyl carrier protein
MTDDRPLDPVLHAVDVLSPLLESGGLDELEVASGDLRVRLARPRLQSAAPGAPSLVVEAQPMAAPPATSLYGEPAPGMRFVTAPLTGVWYSAPSPGARPYLAEGAEVSSGQVVGLIEAMKLFNEIKSDVAGRVIRILVETGTLVKRQQPLLEVDPR